MNTKVIRVFGLIVLQRDWASGQEHVEEITSDLPCTTYCVKGYSTSKRASDGTYVPDFAEGYFATKNNYEVGTFILNVIEDNQTYCYDSRMNGGYHPDITKVELFAGESAEIPHNAKWFLCRGTAELNNVSLSGPTQIIAKTGNAKIIAQTKCFFMVFP